MNIEQLTEIENVCRRAFHYSARRAVDRAFWAAQIEVIKNLKKALMG